MSDFLTRIASLGRGETTAIKPRLPSHFAPAPDTQQAEPLNEAPPVLAAYPIGLGPDRLQRQAASGPIPSTPDSGASDQDNDTSTPQQPVDANTAAHAPMLPPVETGDEFITSQPPASMPTVPESVSKPDGQQTFADIDWAAADYDFDGDTEIQTGPLKPGNKADPVSMRENDMAVRTAAPPAHQKLLVRAQPAGREKAGLADMPALPESPQRVRSEPVVHVNIGRIEVRASTSAPRPQPRPAPARQQSSLSLQDYLARSQTGGKRS